MIRSFTLPKIILPVLLSVFYTLTYGQTGIISGTVLDPRKEAVIGASIRVEGTSLGAATDFDGKYTIKNVPVGKQRITISYIGFQAQTVAVEVKDGQTTTTDVAMKEDVALLNEVVVIGYGTQVRKDMASSVASVKSEDLQDQPSYNFASSLQGKAAGVQITTDNGAAGANTTVRIRGTKSLSSSAEPLYVVDGVPIINNDISDAGGRNGYNLSPLSLINPDDIESVDILKDAAATAIYGARGSNGVIIITTKKGKEGKTHVDFTYTAGISQVAHEVKLLNGPQYAQLYEEAAKNDGASGNVILPNGISKDSIANTNWLHQLLRTGYFNDANLSISGGDAKTNFYVGAGIRDEQSFLVGNKFQRASLRANFTHVVGKALSFGVTTSITRTDNRYVRSGASGGLGTAQSSMLPIYPVYNHDGSYYLGGSNPLAQVTLENDRGISYRSISSFYATINFTKELSFRNEFGFDMLNQIESFYKPIAITGDSAIAADRRDLYITWNYTSTLNYKKTFNENNDFEAIIGFNPTRTTEKYSYIEQKGFAVDAITEPRDGLKITSALAGTGKDYAFNSFFGRVNYKLMNRYLFQVSVRADGSSRFSSANHYGYFPALAFGWVVTEEKFMHKKDVLSFLKLRASIGLTGNAELTDDFGYLTSYSSGQNYGGSAGIGPSNLATKDLRWESSLKTGIGVDFTLWNARLSGLLDLYYEKTYDMLIQNTPLTPSSGWSSVTKNQGSAYNEGLELQLTSNNLNPASKLRWKTTLNYAMNKNRVTSLGPGVTEVSGTNFGDNRAIVGQPIGVWYLAKYAGVDPQTGQPLIYDFDGNKVVADANTTVKYRQAVGSPYPVFSGGLDNNFSIKGFEIDLLLTYSVGNDIYDDNGKRSIGNMGFGWNQDVRTLNRWQNPGDVTDVPKLSLNQNYDFNTTHYLYNASYLRVRTVTLAYNLPQTVISKMKMRAFKIFVSVQNLATLTPYKGWDPETNRDKSGSITQGVSYLNVPQARVFTAGFNVGF